MAGSTAGLTGITDFVAAARAAAEAVPSRTVELAPGGLRVRVTLAGEGIIDALAPGLLASAARGAEPEIELFAFASDESGVRPPPPPWPASAFDGQRVEIAGFSEPPRLALFDIEHGTLTYYEASERLGVQWFRSAGLMFPGEGGAPLRNLLRWGLADHGLYLSHLATAGGLLIGGAGGAGKSTTSLVCALAGLPFTSDDFSAVRFGETTTSHAVFSRVKATAETMELLPGLREFGREAGFDWREKLRLDVSDRIVPSQEVRAIVLPRVAERTGTLRPVRPAESLRRLTNGSLLVMQADVQRSLTAMRELVERLPSYELEVGPDIAAIPAALAPLTGADGVRS